MERFCHILFYLHNKLFRYFFLGVVLLDLCFLLTHVRDLFLSNMNKASHIFGFSSISKPIRCDLAGNWMALQLN